MWEKKNVGMNNIAIELFLNVGSCCSSLWLQILYSMPAPDGLIGMKRSKRSMYTDLAYLCQRDRHSLTSCVPDNFWDSYLFSHCSQLVCQAVALEY